MERFARMLLNGFTDGGYEVTIWRPVPLLGKPMNSTLSGFGKWLGYIDKWIAFPLLLRWRVLMLPKNKRKQTRFHICDHSNAPYRAHLPGQQTGITCHDVLAIRGALGDESAFCNASRTGVVLQKWILRNLLSMNQLAAVSQKTLGDLQALGKQSGQDSPSDSQWQVIPNAFNADFRPMEQGRAWELLNGAGLDPARPYLLHVGSALPRKNRKLLLHMVHALGDRWSGLICFAGQPLDPALRAEAERLGLTDRVVSIGKPDHETLVALYSTCSGFIFPSFSEGFGWPVIEAQACGAPVIASDIPPMPEVSGGAAMHGDPHDPKAFAEAFLKLQDEEARKALVEEGFENCRRFEMNTMIDRYLHLYGLRRINNKEAKVPCS